MNHQELRQYIKKVLSEGLADVVGADVRIRVDVTSPNSPTYNDILTGVRGIENVITVRTDGHLKKVGQKKQVAHIVVRYEAKPNFGPAELESRLISVKGIDLARVKTVDGRPWRQQEVQPSEESAPAQPEPELRPPSLAPLS